MADYDHDGDMDLLVGDDNGNIKLYLRDEEGNLSFEGLLQADGEALTAGFRAAPEWTDWDLDGDFDLLVGSSLGLVTLFINVGSLEEPEFSVDMDRHRDDCRLWRPGRRRKTRPGGRIHFWRLHVFWQYR